jgi:hypothetical protein
MTFYAVLLYDFGPREHVFMPVSSALIAFVVQPGYQPFSCHFESDYPETIVWHTAPPLGRRPHRLSLHALGPGPAGSLAAKGTSCTCSSQARYEDSDRVLQGEPVEEGKRGRSGGGKESLMNRRRE